MKAYIMTTSDSRQRLEETLAYYPSCLPEAEIFMGTAPEETPPPRWWLEKYNKELRPDVPARVYACGASKIRLLRSHLSRFPGEDCLLMEDDVCFAEDFNARYALFMKNVPAYWKILYLGGCHANNNGGEPIEMFPGVLRCKYVVGNECVIFRSDIIEDAIACMEVTEGNPVYHSDVSLYKLIGKYPTYAPLPFIAGQRDGFSVIRQRERHIGFRNRFRYISLKREMKAVSSEKSG